MKDMKSCLRYSVDFPIASPEFLWFSNKRVSGSHVRKPNLRGFFMLLPKKQRGFFLCKCPLQVSCFFIKNYIVL